MYVTTIIDKERPKYAFLRKNVFSADSFPEDWLRIFIPNERGRNVKCPSALMSGHPSSTQRQCLLTPTSLIKIHNMAN